MIKMINGAEEVFVLLSPRWITNICFESIVLRVSKVRLFIREKIRFVSKRHDKKKDGKPKISGEKMFQQIHLGFYGVYDWDCDGLGKLHVAHHRRHECECR